MVFEHPANLTNRPVSAFIRVKPKINSVTSNLGDLLRSDARPATCNSIPETKYRQAKSVDLPLNQTDRFSLIEHIEPEPSSVVLNAGKLKIRISRQFGRDVEMAFLVDEPHRETENSAQRVGIWENQCDALRIKSDAVASNRSDLRTAVGKVVNTSSSVPGPYIKKKGKLFKNKIR